MTSPCDWNSPSSVRCCQCPTPLQHHEGRRPVGNPQALPWEMATASAVATQTVSFGGSLAWCGLASKSLEYLTHPLVHPEPNKCGVQIVLHHAAPPSGEVQHVRHRCVAGTSVFCGSGSCFVLVCDASSSLRSHILRGRVQEVLMCSRLHPQSEGLSRNACADTNPGHSLPDRLDSVSTHSAGLHQYCAVPWPPWPPHNETPATLFRP
mmetsp:Transcript_95283/g.183740  ORF Transcript_95283/g.183740 Transcript_95283/m.183740 type:complete len:208 (-) Transcript_95283:480-1103(-)